MSGAPVPSSLYRRKTDTHKGNYGHVLVVGGAPGMVGAPILAGYAALRSGAGLVSLAVPKTIHAIASRKAPPELMVHALPALASLLRRADVLALGPGLSRRPAALALARRLLHSAQQPIVVDADAISVFKGKNLRWANGAGETVITPHPGEMAGLLGKSAAEIQSNRKRIAASTARKLGVVVVLKGHGTVVASPDGRFYKNATGNPGMSTAGMGDVLTGVIAALIGQGLSVFEAAKAGVYLHGLAGDIAAKKVGQVSLTAGDVLEAIPSAFRVASRNRQI